MGWGRKGDQRTLGIFRRIILSMSLSTPTISADLLDADGRVMGDLACAECGYNLRMLESTGNCPECGMAVVVSARRDRLSDAPGGWLRGITRGARWLHLSIILALPVIYPGILVSCYAVWLLCRTQPGRVEPSLDRGLRVSSLACVWLGGLILLALVVGALVAVGMGRHHMFENWTFQGLPVFDFFFLLGHAAYVLGLLSFWRYLGLLALRVPDTGLSTAFLALNRRWLLAVGLVAGACGLSYGLFRLGFVSPASQSYLVPVAVLLLIACVLIYLWVSTLKAARRLVVVLGEVG